ncbi:renalase isoform X5 [Rhinoraja longicauda]
MMAAAARVLVVGAGLTGGLCAALLLLRGRLRVAVWEAARSPGGRMNTSRDPHDPNCTADLGAQYITATPNYAEKHQSFYEELVSRGILKPFLGSVEGMTIKDEGICNYVAPQGISSIVKYYLSDSDVLYSRRVTRINLKEGKLEVCSDSGPAEMFDAVVLTMPVPQILKLQGDMKSQSPEVGPSLVVHTTVQFGAENVDKDKDDVEPLILDQLQKVLPGLPTPTSVKCHKWRFSQVIEAVPNDPGQMTLSFQPLLVIGGDSLTHSNFDGCVDSALAVLNVFQRHL